MLPEAYGAIGNVDPSNSVLLLGSGFSLEAESLDGKRPPNGSALRHHFLKELGLPPETDYDLKILTDEFADKDSERLYRELYNIFRISKPGPNEESILAETWSRIYTTNYDDVGEMCHHPQGLTPKTFDLTDPVPNKLTKNSIIHLHGSIRSATPENITNSLILGEGSYVQQYLAKSPWFNQFQVDITFASHLFIIGYSMSDYHISALLLENPHIAEKTFFIQGSTADALFTRRTAVYGKPLFIGMDGFAKAIKALPRPEPIKDVSLLKSFKALDPQRDKKGLKPPTANEIFELLTFGAFNYSRCVATLPQQTYVISREKEINAFLIEIEKSRTVIVDSRLGNGKTVFLHLGFIALAARKYSCFLFKAHSAAIDEEIKLIAKCSKPVIFFDEYTRAQDILPKLQSEIPNAKFVVEIRSSIFDVRYHEVGAKMPRPMSRINVNRLWPVDIAAFRDLCDKAGLGAQRAGLTNSTELRDILLDLFESENIRRKIHSTLAPIFQNPARRKVLLLCTFLSNFHTSTDPSFIKSVTGIDPYAEFSPVKEVATELFEIELDDFRIRSSVFSEFAVRHFLSAAEIIDCVIETAFAAAARKTERQYRVLLSNVMQYANLHYLLKGESSVATQIVGIYERLRYDQRINGEPLFWLQYAIAMAEDGRLPAAQEFIDTAYERASEQLGFQTYQIDIQAFRILLLIEGDEETGKPLKRTDQILAKLELVNSMLNEESHRSYAVKVLANILPFVQKRGRDMNQPEKVRFTFWLNTLIQTLSNLSPEYRAVSGSDEIKGLLETAKTYLLK